MERQADPYIGRDLGMYRPIRLLGEGGMGRVYLAEHIRLGRQVALKILRPEYAARKDAVQRFFQEARAVNSIGHKNIVDVTDYRELETGEIFFIMEHLTGQNLGDILKAAKAPLPPHIAQKIALQTCDALTAAHEHGVVHRDMKPDNVFICDYGAKAMLVKLLDFGVAKLVNQDMKNSWQTVTGAVIGTPAYMSPEQAAGISIDHRADIYSFGAILYEMFAGRPIFTATSFGEFVVKHMNEVPKPISSYQDTKHLPRALNKVVATCLEKDPKNRYADVTTLRAALSKLTFPTVLTHDTKHAAQTSPQHASSTNPTLTESGHLRKYPLDNATQQAPDPSHRKDDDLFKLPHKKEPSLSKLERLKQTKDALLSTGMKKRVNKYPSTSRAHPSLKYIWISIAIAIGLTTATLIYLVFRTKKPQPMPRAHSSISEPTTPPNSTSPKQTTCRISFTSEPTGAYVFLNNLDHPIGNTPLISKLTCDSKPKTIIYILPGYDRQEKKLTTADPSAVQHFAMTLVEKNQSTYELPDENPRDTSIQSADNEDPEVDIEDSKKPISNLNPVGTDTQGTEKKKNRNTFHRRKPRRRPKRPDTKAEDIKVETIDIETVKQAKPTSPSNSKLPQVIDPSTTVNPFKK